MVAMTKERKGMLMWRSKMVKTEVENLQQSLNQTSMEVTSPRETRGRDSGLESAEMSDASEVRSKTSRIKSTFVL